MINSTRLFYIAFALSLLAGCVGRTPVEPPRGVHQGKPAVISHSYDDAWTAALLAIEGIGWKVESADKASGTIALASSYVYNPSFANYERVYAEPLNSDIGRSKMKSYLRRISDYEKITPPPAPPNPQFTKEQMCLKLTAVSDAETAIRADYRIFPYHDYKIGYLGAVKSNGSLEKNLFKQIDSIIAAQKKLSQMQAEAPAPAEFPPPPPAPVEYEYRLADIYFDYDRFSIRADAESVLAENFDILRENPEISIIIEGYADIRGTDEYNLNLAQRRADAARDYLVKLGISAERIAAVGKGRTERFAEGATEQAYQLNRRAYFIPIQPGSAPGARIFIRRETAAN
ncbi:MAG: OmpA family protein [Deltaproteobacteria bacterium]